MSDLEIAGFHLSLAQLSRLERNLFHRFVRGQTSYQIARELCMPLKAVKAYRQSIIAAFGVSSAIEMIALAKKAKLPRQEIIEATAPLLALS